MWHHVNTHTPTHTPTHPHILTRQGHILSPHAGSGQTERQLSSLDTGKAVEPSSPEPAVPTQSSAPEGRGDEEGRQRMRVHARGEEMPI